MHPRHSLIIAGYVTWRVLLAPVETVATPCKSDSVKRLRVKHGPLCGLITRPSILAPCCFCDRYGWYQDNDRVSRASFERAALAQNPALAYPPQPAPPPPQYAPQPYQPAAQPMYYANAGAA